MSKLMSWPVVILAACAFLMSRPAGAQGDAVQTFVLKDDIGQAWTHDIVSFPLTRPLSAQEQAGMALLGPDGVAVPCQFSTDGAVTSVAFLADLPAYGESRYQLVRQAPKAVPAPFQIERTADSIRVSNGITGVEVPTPAGRYQDGPLLGIRLKSGGWIGGSRLTTKRAIESYTATVTAEGPVYIDLECRYRFAGDKSWLMKLRVIAGEPVVLIRETFNLDDDSRWDFLVSQGFAPTHVFARPSEDTVYSVAPLKFQANASLVQLFPWVAWWDRRNNSFFGLLRANPGEEFIRDNKLQRLTRQQVKQFEVMTAPPLRKTDDDDMLIAAAGDVAAWARGGPEVYDSGWSKFVQVVSSADNQLAFQLQLSAPGRRWLLGAGSVKDNLVADADVAPAQKLLNRYCETPLDTVKDMPLHWKRTAAFPHLGVNAADVKRLVASPNYAAILAKSGTSRELKSLCLPAIAGQPLAQDHAKIAAFKADIQTKLDAMVNYFRYGNNRRGSAMFGTLVPRIDTGYVLPPLDLALGAGLYTPEEQERIFAQLAFVADKIYSPDYTSPGRSLTGNPNMVTAWCGGLVLLACMMPEHPHAKAWYAEGMSRLDNMLEKWQGPNGAWIEAPHYMMAAIDPIFLAKVAAVNAGFMEGKLDERLIRTVTYLAKISTPPDPNFVNRRHYPPLGNTYLNETTMMFGAVAKMYRQAEPEKAAALQWMWQQQGRPYWAGLGGAFSLDFYKELLMDDEWNPPAPKWASEAFPGFGAVLRSGFPGDRETSMIYHQGEIATQHYDWDQGAFELWAKGRPLSLDWGYEGRAPAWHHNCLDIGNASGKVLEFATSPAADYIHGQQSGWDRQVLFLKDANPLGPNYFVLRDSTDGTGTANWWMWVNTRKTEPATAIQTLGDTVYAVGEHDVDLIVWFAPPNPERLAKLEIKELTVATTKGLPDGSWTSWTDGKTTQQGLHLVQPRGEPLVSLLYPKTRDERAPQMTSLAGGKVIKVVTTAGTDYAFLALAPFTYKEGPITFSGTAATIQVRGKQVTLTLSAGGEISYGKAKLTAPSPTSKTFRTF
ncbi:MAG: hypothetical protein ACYDBB_16335 [Armatimonadota bacterium]